MLRELWFILNCKADASGMNNGYVAPFPGRPSCQLTGEAAFVSGPPCGGTHQLGFKQVLWVRLAAGAPTG